MNTFIKSLSSGLVTKSAEETESIGVELAQCFPPNHVLALHGDLGAGKTTFVRGLARAWKIDEAITSPTYNLYTIYDGIRQLVHLDAYRLETPNALDSLMIEDFLRPPWCLAIEWAEKVTDQLPYEIWHLHFTINADAQHCIKLSLD